MAEAGVESGDARAVVLSIAGSDSGGGAGIQADLKTFEALGVFGTTAVTCVTAQNPREVTRVDAVDAAMVAAQINAVADAFPVAAVKTGMLYDADIIRAVADALRTRKFKRVVVDPVMIATSGATLLKADAVDALCGALLPLATVLTPNLPEAQKLSGVRIESPATLAQAAETLARRYRVACVAKGGHLAGDGAGETARVTDVLFADGMVLEMTAPRVSAAETHGTGCTFSAALAALLARGEDLRTACRGAQRFVGEALSRASRAGSHRPLGFGAAGAAHAW